MAYTAGNLELQLTAMSSDAVNSIDTVIKKLTSLSSVLQSVTKTAGGGKGNGGGFFGGLNFRRIFNVAVMYRFGRYMANIVQYGTDFTETLNLWQVAMRENLDQADEFIKKMNKAYSISQQTLMNAQAIFKNMIGSLGNISDATAYALSESIVQMAADFSSLYNTTFEQAITKFQAALAGQVRPIRSVSGYDITESTLYQVYQELGGTKTVRQLNRTEKQLLSIYAVFQQMQRSGAVGDLSKTLDNYANQSRMLNENFKELKTYTGLFFQDLLQSWGVLKYINAGVIFLTEIVKALTKYEAPNFIEGMFESTVAENEAIDELQGKLLDFDKFRALDSGASNELAIDQTILDAVSQYSSILENVNNEARNLATLWLETLGFTKGENGELTISEEKLGKIKGVLTAIVGIVGGLGITSILGSVKNIITSLGLFKGILSPTTLIIGAIAALLVYLYATNENFRESVNKTFGILKEILGKVLAKVVPLVTDLIDNLLPILQVAGDLLAFVVDISNEFIQWLDDIGLFDNILRALEGAFEEVKAVIASISTTFEFIVKAVQTVYTVLKDVSELKFGNLKNDLSDIWGNSNWRTSGLWGRTSWKSLFFPSFATGASDIDSGTVFRAGEAGKTEAVYTGANGKTNVANVSQMEEAFYGALVRYGRDNRGSDSGIVVQIDGERVFSATRRVANKKGLDFSRV